MGIDIISREFYVGRYIYLTKMLEELPKTSFTVNNGEEYIELQKTGDGKRRRISEKNRDWDKYCEDAVRRLAYEKQLRILEANWSLGHKGSLKNLASHYVIRPNTDNVFNSDLWNALKNNDCPSDHGRQVYHNGIIMRSQFEADAAQILDDLGLEYKYDVCLNSVSQGRLYPDIAIHLPEYNRCGFIELLGLLTSMNYVSSNAEKFEKYINIGLYPNRDIAFVSADRDYRPDHDTILRIIGVILDAIARQHVILKN